MSLPVAQLGYLSSINLPNHVGVTQKPLKWYEQLALQAGSGALSAAGQQMASNAFAHDYAPEGKQPGFLTKLVSGPGIDEKAYLTDKTLTAEENRAKMQEVSAMEREKAIIASQQSEGRATRSAMSDRSDKEDALKVYLAAQEFAGRNADRGVQVRGQDLNYGLGDRRVKLDETAAPLDNAYKQGQNARLTAENEKTATETEQNKTYNQMLKNSLAKMQGGIAAPQASSTIDPALAKYKAGEQTPQATVIQSGTKPAPEAIPVSTNWIRQMNAMESDPTDPSTPAYKDAQLAGSVSAPRATDPSVDYAKLVGPKYKSTTASTKAQIQQLGQSTQSQILGSPTAVYQLPQDPVEVARQQRIQQIQDAMDAATARRLGLQ